MAADPNPHAVTLVNASEPEGDDVSLTDYLGTLLAARWLILGVAAVVLLAGLLFAKFATPVFRSDVLVQVEEKKSSIAGLSDLSDMFPGESPADTEIEILRSRMVLGVVVEQLGLDVEARPHYLPVIGAALARGYKGQQPAAARFAFRPACRPAARAGRSEMRGGLTPRRLPGRSVLRGMTANFKRGNR